MALEHREALCAWDYGNLTLKHVLHWNLNDCYCCGIVIQSYVKLNIEKDRANFRHPVSMIDGSGDHRNFFWPFLPLFYFCLHRQNFHSVLCFFALKRLSRWILSGPIGKKGSDVGSWWRDEQRAGVEFFANLSTFRNSGLIDRSGFLSC